MRGVSRFVVNMLFAGSVVAGLVPASPVCAAAQTGLSLGLDAGYRHDSLDWNIGGFLSNFGFVDVLSELAWDDLEIYQVRARSALDLGRTERIWVPNYFRGTIGYGWITDGENRDSDWAGANRTLEFSRSNNGADDGNVFDLSIGTGRKFDLGKKGFRWAPLIGFSYHEQKLKIVDGTQTLFDKAIVAAINDMPESAIESPDLTGLNSSYDTQWWGVWYGLDLEYQATQKLRWLGSLEYHFVDYYAAANWNLRQDFAQPKSFEHEGDGRGVVVAVLGEYAFAQLWSASLGVDYSNWRVEQGIDRVFLASGEVAATRLNAVNWESFAVSAGLTRRF